MAVTMQAQNLTDYIGKKTGVSRWFTITQQQIDTFADACSTNQILLGTLKFTIKN